MVTLDTTIFKEIIIDTIGIIVHISREAIVRHAITSHRIVLGHTLGHGQRVIFVEDENDVNFC